MHTNQPMFPFYRYWAPKYWLTWFGLGFLRLATLLPFPVSISIGRNIGRILSWVPGKAKKTASINISRCFPELTNKQIKLRVKLHFQSIGVGLVEMCMCWWAADTKLAPRTTVEGLDNLQQVIDSGHGAILLSPHFTTIEIGGTLINRHIPTGVMYRDQKNPLFNALMIRARERNCPDLIHRNSVKTIVRYLRNNKPVWYAPDQNFSGKQSVFADFFGIPAATTSGTARLTSMTKAKILPFYQIRLPDNKGYKMIIEKPLAAFTSDNDIQNTVLVNKAIEQMIRQAPDQYLWSHRRFKTRPEGEKPFY